MAGFSALGTRFLMSTVAFDSWTTDPFDSAIGDLTNISGPTMSAEEIDVSSHDSDGSFREFVAGFLDGGEISFEGNLMPEGDAVDIVDAFADRVNRYFAVVFPASGAAVGSSSTQLGHWMRWMFEGAVTGMETAAPFDDKASFSGTVRVSGQPILTVSSSE